MKRTGLIMVSVLLVACSVAGSTSEDAASVLAEADRLYDRWSDSFDFTDYRKDLEASIDLYQGVLDGLPDGAVQTRAYVLTQLSRAHFELATAYLTDRDELVATFALGADHALAALRLDPAFREAEARTCPACRAALEGANDAEAIFWYGNNFGRYIEYDWWRAFNGGMKDVLASFQRATELDPAFLDGGPWRALGSYLAQVPEILGGDLARAEAAFIEAIGLGPNYLENAVNLAEYVARRRGDEGTFCTLLQDVIGDAADPDIMAAWPLYNELAVRRAEQLLGETRCEGA